MIPQPGFRGKLTPPRAHLFVVQTRHIAATNISWSSIYPLQGLKRLITKAQEYYPTDPSRSIDYIKRSDSELEAMGASAAKPPIAPTRDQDEDDDDDSD